MKAARNGIGGSLGLGVGGLAPTVREAKSLFGVGQLVGDDQGGQQ